MNTEKAKLILASHRATGAEANDATFAAALEWARSDPQLRTWFEQQQTLDWQMMGAVDRIEPPAELRDAIVAALGSARPAAVAPAPTRWHRPVSWAVGIAAAGVITFSILAVSARRATTQVADSALAAFALVDAQHPETHGGHGDEAKLLNRTLNKPTTRLGDALPVTYESLHTSGCRIVQVGGRDVVEMCFRRNGVQFHCYIAHRSDFPTCTAPAKPTLFDRGGAALATWSDDANLYLVVSRPGRVPLEKLL